MLFTNFKQHLNSFTCQIACLNFKNQGELSSTALDITIDTQKVIKKYKK